MVQHCGIRKVVLIVQVVALVNVVRRKMNFAPGSIIRINNPQAVAWTIAAEGSITIGLTHSKGRIYYYPVIEVVTTNKDFINQFWELAGYYGSANYGVEARNPRHKDNYRWGITKVSEALCFLLEIRPYLPIKLEQANLVIEFCQRRLKRWKQRNNLEERDYEIVNEIRKLNKRGRDVQ